MSLSRTPILRGGAVTVSIHSCRKQRNVICHSNRAVTYRERRLPKNTTSWRSTTSSDLSKAIVHTNVQNKALPNQDLDSDWNLMQSRIAEGYREIDDDERHLRHLQRRNFLNRCIERERKDLVFALLRKSVRDVNLFASATKHSLRLGKSQLVCDIIELRIELGHAIDAYDYNAHISALGRLGRIEEAQKVFDTAVGTRNDSIYVYNSMLDACVRVGALSRAESIWNGIREAGLEADAISFVGIMRAYTTEGRVETVQKLFEQMQERLVSPPMPHAYTVLFDCVTKSETEVDVNWFIEQIQSMNGVALNRYILSAMIHAFSKQPLDAEQIQYVFDTVSEFRQEMHPGNGVYATLLQFCIHHGIPQRAIDVWDMIRDDGVTPNGHVYSSMLKACSAMKTGGKVVKEISQLMRQHWAGIREKDTEQKHMRGAFNALLHFYAHVQNIEAASSIYFSMKTHGPSPDRITFHTILTAYVGAGVLSRVEDVLGDMSRVDCPRDTTTFNILFNGCAQSHDVDGALRLAEEMKQVGLSMTVECYTSLIDTCIKDGSEQSLAYAFELFRCMKSEGIQPTAVTYGCILLARQLQGDLEGSFEVYQEACRHGVSPSDRCHNVLITMCTEAGRLDDALDLIKILVRRHGDIAEDTMNSVIRALAADYLDRSLVLLRLMQNRKLKTGIETYNCLMIACCREGKISQACALYKEMISRRLLVRKDVGSALISALSQAGEWLLALRVTNHMFERAGLSSIDPTCINKGWKRHPSPNPSRRNERIVTSAVPDYLSLGKLIVVLVKTCNLRIAMYVFRQVCVLERAAGVAVLAEELHQVFELLIEGSCSAERVEWAVEVFIQWIIASDKIVQRHYKTKEYSVLHNYLLASGCVVRF